MDNNFTSVKRSQLKAHTFILFTLSVLSHYLQGKSWNFSSTGWVWRTEMYLGCALRWASPKSSWEYDFWYHWPCKYWTFLMDVLYITRFRPVLCWVCSYLMYRIYKKLINNSLIMEKKRVLHCYLDSLHCDEKTFNLRCVCVWHLDFVFPFNWYQRTRRLFSNNLLGF